MSNLSESVRDLLNVTFPGYRVYPEWYVSYKNQQLFFDFYIKDLKLFIECQGEQHYKHVKYFHKTTSAYRESLARDRLKREYAKEYKYRILYIDKKNIPQTSSDLINLVHGSLMNDCK